MPAYVTRVGIFTYTRADGSKVREYRPAEEVFHTDSLASLYGAPVTIGHPGSVNPDNWHIHAVGHAEAGIATDTYVSAALRIQKADAIAKVQTKALTEVSCGYSVAIDPTPGIFEGQEYDVVQRNIRYNHIALGPRKWGRAGAEVRLRLDGNQSGYSEEMELHEALAALKVAEKALAERTDGAAKSEARADAAEAKLLALQTAFPAAVETRVALLARVAAIMGADYSCAGKSDRDLAVACIAKRSDGFTGAGKEDAYVFGRFDALDLADPVAALAAIKADAKEAPVADVSKEETARLKSHIVTPPWETK